MIDGIKIVCPSACAAFWWQKEALDFGVSVSEKTGELLTQTRKAEHNGLTFSISPSACGGYYCTVSGSLHKYKNGGGVNWDKFTYSELCTVLQDLSANYHIDLKTAQIQGLEIGVNIPLNYPAEIIIKSAICHKGRAFSLLFAGKYNSQKRPIGKLFNYADYELKLYDKGKQCNFGRHILRVEVKAKRQRDFEPYGVRTLADLQDKSKLLGLLSFLLDKTAGTVFYDFKYKGKGMTEKKYLKFQQYSNPCYWENLTKFARTKALKRYAETCKKYGCIDWLNFVLKNTAKNYLEMLELKAENRLLFPHFLEESKHKVLATFSTLDYVLEKVAFKERKGNFKKGEKKQSKNEGKSTTKTATQKTEQKRRFCCICGRDISNQKKGSRFCSEKLYGKAARQCRNKDSNKRLAIKRKIKRAMAKDLFLQITYRANNSRYTDIIAARELCITREWLDAVESVTTCNASKKTLHGKAAQEFINKLNNKNLQK